MQQVFAHAKTVQLSSMCKIVKGSHYLNLNENKMNFPSPLNCDWQIVSEIGPGLNQDDSSL